MINDNLTCLLALKNIRDFGLNERNMWAFQLNIKGQRITQIMHENKVDTFYNKLLINDPFVIIYDLSNYKDRMVA